MMQVPVAAASSVPSLNPCSAVLTGPPPVIITGVFCSLKGQAACTRFSQLEPGYLGSIWKLDTWPGEPGVPAAQALSVLWTLLWSGLPGFSLTAGGRAQPGRMAPPTEGVLLIDAPPSQAQQIQAGRARRLRAGPRALRIRVLLLVSSHLGKKKKCIER